MNGQVVAMVKAGLSLKIAQIKQATGEYIDDRTDHGKQIAAGYAVAAGLYVAAGVFMIAACLVGVIALFRWLEIEHGQFAAFGIIVGVLLALTILCAAIAAGRLSTKSPSYPSLGTRLGAAIKGNPFKAAGKSAKPTKPLAIKREMPSVMVKASASNENPKENPTQNPKAIRAARNAAQEVLRAPASPSLYGRADRGTGVKAGLLVAASLLGWALVRRRRQETIQAVSAKT